MIALAWLLVTAQAPSAAPAPAAPDRSRFENSATTAENVPVRSRIERRAENVTASENDAAWTMHRFAECLVRTRSGQMLELLSTGLNSPEQNRIVRDVIGWRNRCLRARSMQIDHVLLRGAVAEALYRQTLRGREIGRLDRAPPMLDADPRRNSSAALERFGRCMVARHPDLVRPLIGTRPGSREERTAMQGIMAGFADCLPEAPRRARHPLMLRGAVAEAFYLDWQGLLSNADVPDGPHVDATDARP